LERHQSPALSPVEGLVQVVSGTLTTHFTYNGDGHRLRKVADGVTTTYVIAILPVLGAGTGGLPQVLVETTGENSTAYLHGHDLLAEEDTAWAWHLNDGLGSVRQLTGGNGDVTLTQGYTPFGLLLWQEGDTATTYGFTGEQQDPTVALVFLRARYYDPATGRFLSKDPWAGTSLRPETLNGYAYVLNNAPNGVDPSGMLCIFGFGNCDEEPDLAAVAYYALAQTDFCLSGLGCWGGHDFGIRLEDVRQLQSDIFFEDLYWTWYHPAQAWGLPKDSLKTLMIENWLFEQDPVRQEYDASHPATQLLMRHKGVNDAREKFYRSGCQPMTEENKNAHPYNVKGESNWEAVANYVKAQVILVNEILFGRKDTLGTIDGTLGSYRVEIVKNRDNHATFRVWNKTGRESFTREYLKVMPSWLPETWLQDKTREETQPGWVSETGWAICGNTLCG